MDTDGRQHNGPLRNSERNKWVQWWRSSHPFHALLCPVNKLLKPHTESEWWCLVRRTGQRKRATLRLVLWACWNPLREAYHFHVKHILKSCPWGYLSMQRGVKKKTSNKFELNNLPSVLSLSFTNWTKPRLRIWNSISNIWILSCQTDTCAFQNTRTHTYCKYPIEKTINQNFDFQNRQQWTFCSSKYILL